MTEKQKVFCDEYLIDFNATRAYKKAYPNCKKEDSARKAGSRLLTNVDIQTYIKEQTQEKQERTQIKQDEILQELTNIAFSKGTDFAQIVEKQYEENKYDENGNIIGVEIKTYKTLELTPTAELTDKQKSAITGIKQTTNGIEIKTADKVKALELLGKHLGIFKDKVEIEQDKPFEVNINIRKK